MLYLLTWRDAFPGHSHSDARCRKIVATSSTDTFTTTEKAKFQVIERPDLNPGDIRPYDAVNADDLTGPLLDLDPQDAPKKGPKGDVAWTQAEMDARA